MKQIHVVIPDLFLPASLAKDVCAGLKLPVLEKLLARSDAQPLPLHSLEAWLCDAFAAPAIAPVTLRADGMMPEDGYWLRADPVHLRLDRAQMILQTNVAPSMEEAQQLCAHLNEHFAESGMRFFAPHPQRWYVRLDDAPDLVMHSVYQVEGRNARSYMPQGVQALKWNSLLNEVQMVLYGHPLHRMTEARGGVPVNSVWLWGGGRAATLRKAFVQVCGDSELANAFARAANIPCDASASEYPAGNTLLVWEEASAALRRGDFHAWREAVVRLEQSCFAPLLRALAEGGIRQITVDALQEQGSRRYELTRSMLWRIWKRARSLASYGVV